MSVSRSIILPVFLAFALFGFLFPLQAADDSSAVVTLAADESAVTSPTTGLLEVTGVGQAPQGKGKAQARLLAERAAKVRAYRHLMRALDRLEPLLDKGTGVVSDTGFIRGAKIVEKSYLPGGRVKVKIALDVSFAVKNPDERSITKKVRDLGVSVHSVDHRIVEISEQEWVQWNQ